MPGKMTGTYRYLTLLLICGLLGCAERLQKKEQERMQEIFEDYVREHLEQGTAASDSGRYEEAVNHFREAISLFPGDPVTYNNLGVTYFRMGQMDSAAHAYQKAIHLSPSYAQAHANLANVFLKKEDYHPALQSIERAITHDPDLAYAYAMRGSIYESTNKMDDAIQSYQIAVWLSPEDVSFRIDLGDLLLQKNMLHDAIQEYEQAIDIDSVSARAHLHLGNAYTRKCALDEAKEHYERALQILPEMNAARNNLGLILMSQGNTQEATHQFRQALQYDLDEVTVLFNLSIALHMQDSLQAALSYINKAIRHDTTTAQLYLHGGNVLLDLGLTRGAISAFQQAIQLDSNLAIGHNNLGNALMTDGVPDKARLAFEKGVELYPEYLKDRYFYYGSSVEKGMYDLLGGCLDAAQIRNDYATMFFNLGRAYLELNWTEEAISVFKKSSELAPHLTEPLESLALIYASQGEDSLAADVLAYARFNRAMAYIRVDSLGRAIVLLRESLNLKPGFGAAHAQLGLLYGTLNEDQEAEKAFQRALLIDPGDPFVQVSYGDYLVEKQRLNDAKESYEKAVELNPESLAARQNLVNTLMALGLEGAATKQRAEMSHLSGKSFEYAGSWDRALEEYGKAADLNTANPDYQASQGMIYARKLLYNRAQSFFQRALELDPQNIRSLYGMGLIHRDREKYDAAIRYLKQAVTIDPSFANAHYLLAKSSYSVGELDQARHHMETARKLGIRVAEGSEENQD